MGEGWSGEEGRLGPGRPEAQAQAGAHPRPSTCPAPTQPLVELLHLAREPQLREVPGVDEHVTVGHLDGVRPRVGVRHADKAGVAGWLGGVVRHRVHPAGREDMLVTGPWHGARPARGQSHSSQRRTEPPASRGPAGPDP